MAKVITVAMAERAAKSMLQEDTKTFRGNPNATNFRMLVSAMRVYQETFFPSEYKKIQEGGPDLTIATLADNLGTGATNPIS